MPAHIYYRATNSEHPEEITPVNLPQPELEVTRLLNKGGCMIRKCGVQIFGNTLSKN